MSKLRLVYRCTACATSHPKWAGQCSSCSAWNSLVEDVEGPEPDVATLISIASGAQPMPIAEVGTVVAGPRATGIAELDRVLGGGVVPGSVTLLGGEPGIGKSTLALQLAAAWPAPVLYVSAEESQQQVKGRALRLTTAVDHVWIASETSVRGVVAAIDAVAPELVLVDSIQTIADERVASSPGSATQVRECAQ